MLEQISNLDAEPGDAILQIRRALAGASRETAEPVYEALRAATWRLLTSRVFSPEVEPWFDLFSQIAALLRERFPDLSQRTAALADLAMESSRFGALHSRDKAIAKQHVIEVLKAIGKNGARKAEVMSSTGLKQANLSRILANLIAVGLVDRTAVGKQASFRLSAAGLAALSPDVHPRGSGRLIVSPAMN